MRQLFVAAILACCNAAYCQPTGNVLSRVYHIRFNEETGTAFIIDYEERQYFVTARQIMESAGGQTSIDVMGPGSSEWKTYPVTVLLGRDKCVDVSVLVPEEKKITQAEPIPYPYTFAFGQEAYFLGFPYNLYTSF